MPLSPSEIAKPTGKCAASGVEIVPGDAYVATLVTRPGEERLERLDFALDAWSSGERPEPPLGVIGSWRTTMPEPNAAPRPLIDDDALVDLFEQLGEADDTRRLAFRYILALILIRKRLLRLEGSDGGTLLVRPKGVELPPERGGDGPAFVRVEDPGLDEESIADATEQLGGVMSTEDNA